jgi:hypothetical protein
MKHATKALCKIYKELLSLSELGPHFSNAVFVLFCFVFNKVDASDPKATLPSQIW